MTWPKLIYIAKVLDYPAFPLVVRGLLATATNWGVVNSPLVDVVQMVVTMITVEPSAVTGTVYRHIANDSPRTAIGSFSITAGSRAAMLMITAVEFGPGDVLERVRTSSVPSSTTQVISATFNPPF